MQPQLLGAGGLQPFWPIVLAAFLRSRHRFQTNRQSVISLEDPSAASILIVPGNSDDIRQVILFRGSTLVRSLEYGPWVRRVP